MRIIICIAALFSGCPSIRQVQVPIAPTPLVGAILNHNLSDVKRLLDSGADPNQLSGDGEDYHGEPFEIAPPLTWTAEDLKSCDTQILRLLIEHGANPNLPVLLGSRASNSLNTAISHGRTAAVNFLLQHGAKPDLFDPPKSWNGRTSLFMATMLRGQPSYKLFSRIDSEVYGDTSWAHRQKIYDTIINLLLVYGASPTLADPSSTTPLHAAASYCDSSLAVYLIAHGASLVARDWEGDTPQNIAEKLGCVSVLSAIRRFER